jgi:hypothetical protein
MGIAALARLAVWIFERSKRPGEPSCPRARSRRRATRKGCCTTPRCWPGRAPRRWRTPWRRLRSKSAARPLPWCTLSVLPKTLRTQAPVGRLLEWHQLKQVGGLLIAAVTWDLPGVAPKLAAMPAAQVTQMLNSLNVPAEEADRLKRRGLYVDMDSNGRIREPSEITEAEVASQLDRARQAADSAGVLLGPKAQARFAHPPAEAVEFSRAWVSVLTQAGRARTPEAAVDVMLNAVSKLQNRTAVQDAQSKRGPGGPRRQRHPA